MEGIGPVFLLVLAFLPQALGAITVLISGEVLKRGERASRWKIDRPRFAWLALFLVGMASIASFAGLYFAFYKDIIVYHNGGSSGESVFVIVISMIPGLLCALEWSRLRKGGA